MFHSLLNRHMSHGTHFLLNTEVKHVSLVHRVWILSCFVLQWASRRPQERLCGPKGHLDRQYLQPFGSRQAERWRLHQCIMLSVRSEWQIQNSYPWLPFSCLILSPLITLNSVWKEPYCFKCDRKKSECMFPPIPVFLNSPFEILSRWFIAVFPLSPQFFPSLWHRNARLRDWRGSSVTLSVLRGWSGLRERTCYVKPVAGCWQLFSILRWAKKEGLKYAL